MRFHGELRTPEEVGLKPLGHAAKAHVAAYVRAISALGQDEISREELTDRRQARLQQVVEKKRRQGNDVVEPEMTEVPAAAEGEEPDLFDAIRRSLHAVRGRTPGQRRGHAADGAANGHGLAALSKDELLARARGAHVRGRSVMSRQQLIAALRTAEG
jgi:non-homologous end joining protein Ku